MDDFYGKITYQAIRTSIFITLTFVASISAKGQLWVEDFSSEADGATTGTAGGTLGGSWSTSYSGSGIFAKANLPIVDEGFHISGTTSQAVWSTNTIDITSVGYAIINVDVFSAFVDGNDYLRIAYVLDGVEVIFYAAEVPVQILNLQGQKVFEKIIQMERPGILRKKYPGVPFIRIVYH